ncbi:MMPL family transporter [Cellulomonas gilvus]|uniref:Putative integral membrane protein n=1 Tax=Cellulomonas gilvus (strain ATCC 13127 / NRRL B-14078) TaxID=593907 RepID=F8A0H6_CELGA|nr:MMPL family transporter [Cellulomonas gilvus]AEI11520.1 putative integral membrane protein [Cellulomonas gilvus ATCC 13127]
MAELLYRIGRFAARRAWLVIGAWVLALGLAVGGFLGFGGTLSEAITIPGTPTAEVTDRLEQELPSASGAVGRVVLQSSDGSELTDEQQAGISAALAEVGGIDGVVQVADPFATRAQLAEQAQQVTDGQTQVDEGRAQLDAGQQQIDDGRAQLEAGQAELDATVERVGENAQTTAAQAQLDEQRAQLDAGQKELDANRAELEAKAAQLADGRALLDMAAEIRTVSTDGSVAVATVVFELPSNEIPDATKKAVTAAVDGALPEGVTADYSTEIAQGAISLGGAAEAIGVLVAAIVLVVMLGTFVAAGLPLLNALVGVGVAAAGAMAFSGAVVMTSVTPVLGAMLGLAVGIDYTLFILNRHRRQLRTGMDVHESVGLANGTSGNAVVFAGATVLIALLGLNLTGIPFLGLMGTVAAASIAVAVLVAITLTPAMLGLLGRRILPRKHRDEATAPVAHEAAQPMSNGRAWVSILVGIGVLAVVAIPATSMRLGLPTGASEPADSTQYRAYAAVSDAFGAGVNGPLVVVADVPGGVGEDELVATQARIGGQLAATDDVVAVAPVGTNDDRSVLVFQVIPADGPDSESTTELVHTLRATAVDGGRGTFAVAGNASANIDISEKLADALPVYLAVVIGLSIFILIAVFRSFLVPIVATGGFVLSLFAAMGGVTAVYQWGWLADVFGVSNPGPVLSFLPTLLVGILFGLAMDYQLFLTSGMREAYAHGAPARRAVMEGLHAGRAVVTAAAIIMVSVFGGFMFSHLAVIRPLGFALAFGVLLDAFVVRMLIMPAVMHLAGDEAWWLPTWIDRVMPDVDVEGARLERRHHVPTADLTPHD